MPLDIGIFAPKIFLYASRLNTQENFGFSYNLSWALFVYKPCEDMISEIKWREWPEINLKVDTKIQFMQIFLIFFHKYARDEQNTDFFIQKIVTVRESLRS